MIYLGRVSSTYHIQETITITDTLPGEAYSVMNGQRRQTHFDNSYPASGSPRSMTFMIYLVPHPLLPHSSQTNCNDTFPVPLSTSPGNHQGARFPAIPSDNVPVSQ